MTLRGHQHGAERELGVPRALLALACVFIFATPRDADGTHTGATVSDSVESAPVPASGVRENHFARETTCMVRSSYPPTGAVGRPEFSSALNRADSFGRTRGKALVQARPNLPVGGFGANVGHKARPTSDSLNARKEIG